MNLQNFNDDLINFLYKSPTPYHAVKNMTDELKEHGFRKLYERDSWNLKTGECYYVTRNESSIIAFRAGNIHKGFRMIGAHTDSPCLKVKPNPEISKHQYLQLGVEVYGGALLNPWFDRDLSLAGRVQYLTSSNEFQSLLINFEKPIATIPSLAIHLDRKANNNRSINPQTDIPPVLLQLSNEEKADFRKILQDHISKQKIDDCKEVLDYDLSFYDCNKPAIIGLHKDFIASARLDNLLSCFVGLRSLINHKPGDATPLLVCNDHEEIGSQSAIGAQGPFLKNVLERIATTNELLIQSMSHSMLISTDNAHAIHPNFSDKYDNNHGPLINKGTVIKINNNHRYATNDETASLFKLLSRKEKACVQYFVTRTDTGCGSTIGPLTAAKLGVRTLDIGLPTFGMHSIRELAGTKDAFELSAVLSRFLQLNAIPF